MNNKQSFIDFISLAYVIGAILVVFGHSYTFETEIPKVMLSIRTFIYTFHMPLFLFIGGFVFSCSKSVEKKGYFKYVFIRALKLLIPYLILSLLFVCPKYFLSKYLNEKIELSFTYIVEMLFIPRNNVWGHFWFLPTLFIISCICGVFQKINKVFMYVLLVISFALCVCPIPTNLFAVNDICDFLFYYVLGMTVCDLIINYKQKILKWYYGIIAFIISILLFIFINIDNVVLLKIKTIIGSLLSIYFVLCLSKLLCKSMLIEGKPYGVRYLQSFVYPIFIMGWPSQQVANIIFEKLLHTSFYVNMLAMFVFGIVIPVVIVLLYKKIKVINCKFLNYLLGV